MTLSMRSSSLRREVDAEMRSSSLRREVDAEDRVEAEREEQGMRGARLGSGGAAAERWAGRAQRRSGTHREKKCCSARALATALNDTIAFQNQKSVGSRSSYSQPLSRSSYSQPLPRSPTCIPNPNFDPNCDPHP